MAFPVVETKYGKLQGVMEEDVLVFKGIPYAAPPVGQLRWKPPVDPAPWEGVRVCDTYGPRPVQHTALAMDFEPWGSDFYFMGYPAYSEDCLYLNVATDAKSGDEKRPVFMWFHGGGLSSGYSYEVEFNPTVLAKKGIVIVSVGQRLNIFGYLSLPQLSREQGGISGNYGLMDEVKALDWVRENIAAFGGDPDNITIGGQSGGTAKTGSLARCPAARGKIRRVINQSALNWKVSYPSMAQAEAEGQSYLEALGISKDTSLEELREMDAEVFLGKPGSNLGPHGPRMPGSMVHDGKWVPAQNAEDSMEQYAYDLDYLVGGNYGECVMSDAFVLGAKPITSAEEFHEKLRSLVGQELYDKYDCGKLFPVSDEDAYVTSRHLAVEGLTGFGGNAKNLYFGEERSKKCPEAKTYSYIFSRVPPTRPVDERIPRRGYHEMLAWHSAELWYMFDSLRIGGHGKTNVPPVRPWEAWDVALADIMSSYWANFIRCGNPNGENLPYWPAAGENHGWIDLGDTITAHEGIESPKDALLLEYARNDKKTRGF